MTTPSERERRLVRAGLRPDRARALADAGFDVLDVWPLDLSFFRSQPCSFTAGFHDGGAS